MKEKTEVNPLQSESVFRLMVKFAVPSILGMLVSSFYNIVDQLFIGHAVGIDGNTATNVAFPFTTACTALALLFGIGGASCFNLTMGRGDKKQASFFAGNAFIRIPKRCIPDLEDLRDFVNRFLQPSTKDRRKGNKGS